MTDTVLTTPTPYPNTYGTVADVAVFVRRYTNGGIFDHTTRPMEAEVQAFMNRLSARVNVYLAEAGFAIPIVQTDCVLVLSDFVISTCVDYCHWVNSAGRFFDNKTLKARSFQAVIDEEVMTFVRDHADGLEALGAVRNRSATYGFVVGAYDHLIPMFQRGGFGWRVRDTTQSIDTTNTGSPSNYTQGESPNSYDGVDEYGRIP